MESKSVIKKATVFCAIAFSCYGQVFSQGLEAFQWDGLTRNYRIFIPSSYDASNPVPLVVALHGMNDNSAGFQSHGFNYFAESDTFIVVYPEASVDPLLGVTTWNCGVGALGVYLATGVDDIGFVSALIDSVVNEYSIDLSRIYAAGHSLGGFMTEKLACELNDKIAAVASISGTIGAGLNCNPGRPVPVMHMHGTSDDVITYDGEANLLGVGFLPVGMSVDDLILHWTQNNGCLNQPDSTHLDASPATSGYSIDRFNYGTCEDSSEVLLYRINNANHPWLGSYATEEVWDFFSRHRMPVIPSGIEDVFSDMNVYPNPFSDVVIIDGSLNMDMLLLYDLSGKEIENIKLPESSKKIQLNTSHLENGVYILKLVSDNQASTQKLILRR